MKVVIEILDPLDGVQIVQLNLALERFREKLRGHGIKSGEPEVLQTRKSEAGPVSGSYGIYGD